MYCRKRVFAITIVSSWQNSISLCLASYLQFSSVQLLSRVRFFATPRITVRQASLSITHSQSSLRFTSIESVMLSSHLILGSRVVSVLNHREFTWDTTSLACFPGPGGYERPNVNPRISICFALPSGSEGKASACSAGDLGSIPGLGRSPGEGNGNPLQYSCLENPMDGGTW